MKKGKGKYLYRRICALLLICVATGMFAVVWVLFVKDHNVTRNLMGRGNIGMALMIYAILFGFMGYGLRAFKIGVERKANIMASVGLTAFVTDAIEVLLSMAITGQFRFFWAFMWRYILLCIAQVIVLCLIAIPMINLYRKRYPPLKILEIYGDYHHGIHNKINSVFYKYRVSEMVHYSVSNALLHEKVKKYDAVLISDVPSHYKNIILKMCVSMDKRVYLVPKISDIIVKSAEELNLIDTPLFLCRNIGMSTYQKVIKRTCDVILSGMALVVLSPILLVTAIAIKLEDGGPVFFKQERCTINNKKFMIIKFRSMIVDAEKDGRPHPAGEKDDRITKVGNIIRATRIDELPQLINILRGDMSIVGPRPERIEHVEKYTEKIPEFTFRSKVKGGLTGYAQVYGKYNTTALDKLKLDLIYIMNYSLLLDVQIIFETVKILFQKESTEGFSEDRIAEMHNVENTNE
ncbi:MAG: sugar transferase [Solobacterium sp.]|nr:sugar transferase [Solobacterium sp.]